MFSYSRKVLMLGDLLIDGVELLVIGGFAGGLLGGGMGGLGFEGFGL